MEDSTKIIASIVAATGIFLGMAYTKPNPNYNESTPAITRIERQIPLRRNNLDSVIRNVSDDRVSNEKVSNNRTIPIHDAVYRTPYLREVSEKVNSQAAQQEPLRININITQKIEPRVAEIVYFEALSRPAPVPFVVYRPIACAPVVACGPVCTPAYYHCRTPWFPGKNIGKGVAWVFGWRPHHHVYW